jgi:hypothetical protein
MKASLLFLTLLLCCKISIGQDTIIKTNGHKIVAVVQEVGTTEIKYKKFATLATSPIYDIFKYQVSMIKYHDGTVDKFNNTAVPLTALAVNPTYNYNALDTNPTKISAAYMYFAAMASPVNMYNAGTDINTYWQDIYSGDPHQGTLTMNKGNALMYTFLFGASLEFSKRNTWSYEFQYDVTPAKAIYNKAAFPDSTGGSLSMRYMGFNDLIQYTRGIDTGNRFQLGGELSLDIGLNFGSEIDSISQGGTFYEPIRVSNDYDEMHLGGHIALVAKYFMGKKKGIGLEMRAGYRFMKMGNDNAYFNTPGQGYDGPIDWSGAFVSFGIVFRTRAYYSINCSPYYY